MSVTTIHEAKTNLSRLIEMAERGEEVVIARGKKPVVRLVPIEKHTGKRPIGLYKGKFKVPDDFWILCPRTNWTPGVSNRCEFFWTRVAFVWFALNDNASRARAHGTGVARCSGFHERGIGLGNYNQSTAG
jgi:prevent-host-death family protein